MSKRERRIISDLVQENEDLKQLANLLQFTLLNSVADGTNEVKIRDLTIGQMLYSLGLRESDVENVPVDELPDVISVRMHDLLARIKTTGYIK